MPIPTSAPTAGSTDSRRHRIRPYLKLARLDRPIGTWLLLFPCWWSQALATQGWPDLWMMALFGIGAVVMRGAGCTVNDILDRDIDGIGRADAEAGRSRAGRFR